MGVRKRAAFASESAFSDIRYCAARTASSRAPSRASRVRAIAHRDDAIATKPGGRVRHREGCAARARRPSRRANRVRGAARDSGHAAERCGALAVRWHPKRRGCTSGINPNGVAWGGQIDSFGLFIESSMDLGHSCPSATFNNLALHEGGAKTFAIDVVEVWSPAVAESDAEDELGGSGGGVLNNDKFAADKNILMAAGLYQAHHERA